MNTPRILRLKIDDNTYKTEKTEKTQDARILSFTRILSILTKRIGRIPARRRPPFDSFILPRSAAKRLTLRQTLLPVKFRACRLLRRVHKYDKTISNYK